ncbi:hypothetical protein BDV18DRAFT_155654 [Aspergillus unguis]
MRIPPTDSSLLQFLKKALRVHHHFISGGLSRADSPIYVIGNPSADLDSIVSALVYSYFANNRVPRDYPRPHVPLINLDNVASGPELRRLRPEFIKALHLSNCAGETSDSSWLGEHFLTVSDFITQLKREAKDCIQADSVLVDWNALPVRSSNDRSGKGSLPGLPVDFTVVGCIDHHADEAFLPPIAESQPSTVKPAGSCTSLIVAELQRLGLWQKSDTASASEEQCARLALSSILEDTTNLTSKDKVTSLDTLAYGFLLPKATATDASWSADKFYDEIHKTKQNSLELLTVDEILGRDYKQWAEKTTREADDSPLQIGICSMVKSISWVTRKAGNAQSFFDSLKSFAGERNLDVVAVMTAFSSAKENRFSRELLVCGLNDRGVDSLKAFVSDSSEKLGLEDWHSLDGDDHSQDIKDTLGAPKENGPWTQLWVQTDLSKSRKQVAPLIRGAASSL